MNHLFPAPGNAATAAASLLRRPCQSTLSAGKAMRLRAARRSVLHISQGRLWATFDGPHHGAANDQGDLVLSPGDSLDLAPGRSLVVQSWDALAADPVRFSLDPVREDDLSGSQDVLLALTRWQATVLEPAHRLAESARQFVRALAGLLWGLVSYAELLVAGRGRVLGRFESNAP